MRAKQLEILRVNYNTNIGDSLGTIIYNLAFSPKIRHIDMSWTLQGSDTIAEAIYKLIKISGAIETLNMNQSGIVSKLKDDFFQALGENKTIKHLYIDSGENAPLNTCSMLGKAIAMNAYRNGALEMISIEKWFKYKNYL